MQQSKVSFLTRWLLVLILAREKDWDGCGSGPLVPQDKAQSCKIDSFLDHGPEKSLELEVTTVKFK